MGEKIHYYRLVGEEGVLMQSGRVPDPLYYGGDRTMNSLNQNVSSFTIHAAPAGSRIVNDQGIDAGNSSTGHVFLSVRQFDHNTGSFKTTSIGLSPGADWSTSKDNLSFNDNLRYPDASTITVEGGGFPHYRNVGNLFDSIMDYKSGKKEPPNYNLLLNNCIQFAQDLLESAGIKGIKLGLTPDGAEKNLEHSADSYVTPLILDLNGDGVHTLDSGHGVSFDFDGHGQKSKTGWAHPDDGLLVLDKNADGVINVGAELFGSNSSGKEGGLAKDGFEALSLYDANGDGFINAADSVWQSLQIWQDRNSDGVSQQDELTSLDTLGIASISLNATRVGAFDDSGNIHQLIASFQWADGREGDMVDVLLHQQSEKLSSDQSGMDVPSIFPTVDLIGQSPMLDETMGIHM